MVKYIEGSLADRNVEEILRIVRRMCTVSDYPSETPDLISHKQLSDERANVLAMVNSSWNIQPKRPEQIMDQNPVKRFIKRVIRKLFTWYAADLIQQQNTFNAFVVRYLNALDEVIDSTVE